MERFSQVIDVLHRYYTCFGADYASREHCFDDVVSEAPEASIIGSAGEEFWRTREEWRAKAFCSDAKLIPGDAVGFSEGTIGWVFDQPKFILPDTTPISARVTGVLRQESGGWKLVHVHISLGVPNQEGSDLPGRVKSD